MNDHVTRIDNPRQLADALGREAVGRTLRSVWIDPSGALVLTFDAGRQFTIGGLPDDLVADLRRWEGQSVA